MKKLAVVVFNLGGPDQLASVRPFLFNLFNDRNIIGLPQPLRWIIASLISSRRAPVARDIYAKIGGRSPLLEQTLAQAHALEEAIRNEATSVRVFIAMRYWHPLTEEAVAAVQEYNPDQVILLPLYPQFSTTTTGSSIKEWHRVASYLGLRVPTKEICCWPTEPGWITTMAEKTTEAVHQVGTHGEPRVLFSAHGLPKRVIASGDPYQWQIEKTAAAIAAAMTIINLDWQICYQSRVGPLEWIGPSTEDEIRRAGHDAVPVVVVPIAFVSEHSETLVELDIEYRELAEQCGVPAYVRVATVQDDLGFIEGLARLVRLSLATDADQISGQGEGTRFCPQTHCRCAKAEELSGDRTA